MLMRTGSQYGPWPCLLLLPQEEVKDRDAHIHELQQVWRQRLWMCY